jgi:branched-chain amino acid transport system substrate-binding protein
MINFTGATVLDHLPIRAGKFSMTLRSFVAAAGLVTASATLCLPAQAQNTAPVRIGILTDMSGNYADVGGAGSVTAAEMAVADYGKTVLGRSIEILQADHQNKADVGSVIARKWIDLEHVTAIVDLVNSSVALAVQELARSNDVVIMPAGAASPVLTGKACLPNSFQWGFNTYALARTLAEGVVKRGGKRWFFVTADYTFGHDLERDARAAIASSGGSVAGTVSAPFMASDFSSFLLTAQASGADVIALANAGNDFSNSVKQASEFGLMSSKQKVVGLWATASSVRSAGLATTQGMLITESFYWNLDDKTRAFAKRFDEARKMMPSQVHAAVYSAVFSLLHAIEKAGSTDSKAVSAAMRTIPIDDMFARHATVRADGSLAHDMYLFQVKTPAESTESWDLYKLVETIPGDRAFRPLAESDCGLAQH